MKQYSKQQIKYISDNFQQGQRAIQSGQFDRAEKCYIDILKIGSDITEARNALAFIYTSTQQHVKAITQLKKILEKQPNDSNAHHNLANNLFELQNYDEAIYHYLTAIRLNPNFVDSQTLCGIAYRKLKNFELAIQHFNQALKLDNTNAKAFHALGMTYAEIEDYSRATKCLETAVDLKPDNEEFNLCLASVLEKSGREHDADIQYHHTCSHFPNYLDGFVLYGNLLSKNRFFYEALECFSHAHKLSPESLDISDNLGSTYLGLGNAEMAINLLSDIVAKEPKRVLSLISLEQAYQDSGNLDVAMNLCDKIIDIDTNKPTGYILKSRIRKSKANDGLAEHLLQFSSQKELSNSDKIEVDFALGKIYDDQNNYKQAFISYASANTLRNKSLNYNRKESENSVSDIINLFNTNFFNEHQHLGCESDLPIMIVGMPRSGSTLTEQIISSHSKVIGAGEVEFWGNTVLGMQSLLKSESNYPKCLKEMHPIHAKYIAEKYEATLRKITGVSQKPQHITDKMPHNFLTIGLIAILFPNVKIIHTKRDPIDTCLSIYFQNFNDNHPYSFDLSHLGFYYKQYERIMKHWHKVLPGRILDIEYADTIADPEFLSRKLISHIGLEWDDACLSPHKSERVVQTLSHWQVRQPIYKTSVERWKNYEEFLEPLKQILLN